MARPSSVKTTVVTSDTTLKATPGKVWWVSVTNSHATDNAAIEISDGSTPDRWATVVPGLDTPASSHVSVVFDPPIACDTDIRIDITGGTVVATVAWT